MKKLTLILLILFFSISSFSWISIALAEFDTGTYQLQVPLFDYAESQNIAEYILRIYQYAMIVLIPLLIVVIIMGGIMWIAAAGDSGRIKKAKDHIISGFIGVGIALFSYVLLSLVGINALNLPGIIKISRIEGDILEGEFDNDVADGGGGAIMSEVPHLYQGDYKNVTWDGPGGSRTVSSGGCGLVSSVMVIKYYGKNITIEEAAQWTVANGWRKRGQKGITFEGIAALAGHYGLKFQQLQLNLDTIKNYASNKKPVIVLVRGPCKFTQNGHFIVLAGWDASGNQFIVNDPGSHKAARTHGTWAEIAQGCKLEGAGAIIP